MSRAVFANCGQVCLGTERVYVERPIFEKFTAALKAKAEGLKRGDPKDKTTSQGPLISQEHRKKVLKYYDIARTEGATVVTGGGVPRMDGKYESGSWIEPTIWTGLDEGARAVREEIFGPCCHVPPFDKDEDAIAMANDSPYGLAASIWTQDLAAPTGSPAPSTSASPGSIAGSCAICARRSAAPSSPASAARAACIRSSSTPSSRNICVKL